MIKKLSFSIFFIIFTILFILFSCINVNANDNTTNEAIKNSIDNNNYEKNNIKIIKAVNLAFQQDLPESGENVLMQLSDPPSNRIYLLCFYDTETNTIEQFFEGEKTSNDRYRFKGLRKSGQYVLITAKLKDAAMNSKSIITLLIIVVIAIIIIAYFLYKKKNFSRPKLIEQKQKTED